MKKTLLIVLMMLLSAGQANAYATDASDPVSIIESATSHILEMLENRREEFTENPELLRTVVREDLMPLIDLDYSARLILGRSGRGVSTEQLRAFSEAMSNLLINRYADGLLQFRSNEQFDVLPLKGNNTDKLTRVRTRIRLDSGSYAPVDYAFHKTDQGWKAFDVTVEGISYVLTFRNQIAPRVDVDGIDKVTAEIIAGNVSINEE